MRKRIGFIISLDVFPKNLIAQARKPIIGYSDISAYHLCVDGGGTPLDSLVTRAPEGVLPWIANRK